MDRLRIAVVSKADAAGGGASRVAEDLARTLGARGHSATHFVSWSRSGFDKVRPLYGPRVPRTATLRLNSVARKLGFGESIPLELPSTLANLARGFDLVHVHDTTTALSPTTLRTLSRLVPTVWTLHDCSGFTGGCLYPQLHSCSRYKDACGTCPALGEWPLDGLMDMTSLALRLRRGAHASGRIELVAPSEWMADQAHGSGNLPRRPTVVANMVDTNTFAPRAGRAAERAALGLAPNVPVLVSSAGHMADRRKGVASVIGAARAMAERGVRPRLILIGAGDTVSMTSDGDVDVETTGYVSGRDELARWLDLADAYVFCATAENQPLAVLEAMASGVPIYGWDTGGVPELVADGAQGRMVAGRDVALLGRVLADDWSDGTMARLRDSTRARALEFSEERFYQGHLGVYARVLGLPGEA